MKKNKHVLNKVWEDFPQNMGVEIKPLSHPSFERIIAELFSVGEFYYYLLNIGDNSIHNCHENALRLHGLKQYPKYLQEIISLIHPEDIAFVIEAERMAIEKVQEIGWEHHLNLKSSYCFRMRTAHGDYQLFHHQALHTQKDEEGRLIQAINIHTNIHHITQVNNYTVAVTGIGGRSDFHQMHLMPTKPKNSPPDNFTRRELEILHLIANGYSSTEISDLLILSGHTIRTHRKNILRKTNAKNASELVKKCIEWGYI